MLADEKIKVEDLERLVVTDSPEEAVRVVISCYEENCAAATKRSEARATKSNRRRVE
jgi:hypothetical protein